MYKYSVIVDNVRFSFFNKKYIFSSEKGTFPFFYINISPGVPLAHFFNKKCEKVKPEQY